MKKDNRITLALKEYVLPIVLLIIVVLITVSACGKKADQSQEKTSSVSAADTSEDSAKDQTAGRDDAKQKETLQADGESEYTIKNQKIADNENITFTINSVRKDSDWGQEIEITCENHTEDSLLFSWENVSVNGYMIDPVWATEVAGKKNAKGAITFAEADLKECGIEAIENLSFELRVSLSDDWSADTVYEDTCEVWPTGEDESSWTIKDREKTEGEQVVSETDDYLFVILDSGEDSDWGYYEVDCYMENRTDETLFYTWGDVSVNGTMADPFWATTVAPGKRAYSKICFYDTDLKDAGVSEVEEIEYRLQVYDYDQADGNYRCDEVFQYKPVKD